MKSIHSPGLYLFTLFLNANIISCVGPLAQLVEQLTLNQQVQGSSPWRLSSDIVLLSDSYLVVELAPNSVRVRRRRAMSSRFIMPMTFPASITGM
jgi:hypothetical protein